MALPEGNENITIQTLQGREASFVITTFKVSEFPTKFCLNKTTGCPCWLRLLGWLTTTLGRTPSPAISNISESGLVFMGDSTDTSKVVVYTCKIMAKEFNKIQKQSQNKCLHLLSSASHNHQTGALLGHCLEKYLAKQIDPSTCFLSRL